MDIRASFSYCKEGNTSLGVFHSLNNDTDIRVVSFSLLRETYNKEIQNSHTHDFYIVAFFEEGQCIYYRDFDEIMINSRTIIFMSPGQYHHYGEGEIQGYGICFSHNAFIGLDIEVVNLIKFYLFANKDAIKIDNEHIFHEFTDIVKMIHCEYERRESPLTLNVRMKLLLQYYLVKLYDYYSQYHKIDIQKNFNIFLNFSAQVERNFKKWHKVAHYAEDLHISKSQELVYAKLYRQS